jgi:serine/threonine-protein kinase
LTISEKKRLSEQPTSNLEAYNLYLLGRSNYNLTTPEGFEKAIEYYNKAILLDAEFALAYSSLAVAELYKGAGYCGVRPHDAMPKAMAYAKKALEINPGLSHAFYAIGEVNDWYLYDWKTAEESYRKAIELNPSNADAHLYQAIHMLACRRIEQALKENEQALQLDPNSLLIRQNCIFNIMFARQFEDALSEARSVVLMNPTNSGAWALYGMAQSYLNQLSESVTSLLEADRLTGKGNYFVRLNLAYAFARAGRRDDAISLLRELHELEEKEFVWPMGFAITYAHLGETEKALSYLERSFEERVGWMLLIGTDPSLDILRKEPRFKELVRKIGPAEAIAEIDKFG